MLGMALKKLYRITLSYSEAHSLLVSDVIRYADLSIT